LAKVRLKVYIESSILTDWLFLDTVKFGRARKAVGQEAKFGYSLFNDILRGKYRNSAFVTSSWAVSESLQNYLRSYAMFNMLFDNLSLRYFEAVRDYPRYKMPRRAFSETKQLFLERLRQAEKRNRLAIVNTHTKAEASHKYLYMGFDAVDAEHLAIAIDLIHANVLVTKDRDFHDRKTELRKFGIDTQHPSDAASTSKKLE